MAGHGTVLGWSKEQFETLVVRLDKAFEDHRAALFFDARIGAHVIDVFEPVEAGFSWDEWNEIRPFLPLLDQFIMYAFEAAPDNVVATWANDHVKDTGTAGVERVRFVRENAPHIRSEWRARASGAGPTFGDISSQLLLGSGSLKMLVRLDCFIPGGKPRRRPLESSRQWFSIEMTANELARLSQKLGDLSDELVELGGDRVVADDHDEHVDDDSEEDRSAT